MSRVRRRIAPALAAATLLLAACGGTGAPVITDPKEIVTRGLEAMGEIDSVHFVVSLDGTATLPEIGGEMNLSGTELSGDVDIANVRARLEFSVPAMFGITGEVIQIGRDSYLNTSLTGDTWSKSTLGANDPMGGVTDPTEQLTRVRAFLDKEGVELEKLADAECGEETCYAVRVTIPAAVIAEASPGTDLNPGELVGEALVLDLLFDRDDRWLTGASTRIVAESLGELTLTLSLSAFNEPVQIEAPPEDEVTEGDPTLPF